jgi:hypothetical protein
MLDVGPGILAIGDRSDLTVHSATAHSRNISGVSMLGEKGENNLVVGRTKETKMKQD